MTVLLVIVAALGAFVLAVLRGLATDEARGRIRRYVVSRVDATIASMPAELRAEWEEEWRADAEAALTMPLTAVLFPRGLRQSAGSLPAEWLALAVTAAPAKSGDGCPQGSRHQFGLTPPAQVVKRTFDIVVAAVALVSLAPAFLVLAVAVKLDSPGPVLDRHSRLGGGMVPFEMFRFRSTIEGVGMLSQSVLVRAWPDPELVLRIDRNSRVTRLGRFLRRTGLDDLPVLFNVLGGSMSLVGPLPVLPIRMEENFRIAGHDPHRLDLTPGMTGRWQDLGSSHIPLADMVRVDYLYVANWSVWGDIRIIVATAARAFRRP